MMIALIIYVVGMIPWGLHFFLKSHKKVRNQQQEAGIIEMVFGSLIVGLIWPLVLLFVLAGRTYSLIKRKSGKQ